MARIRHSLISVGCALAFALPVGAGEFEGTFPVTTAGTLTIELERGSVAVFAHDAPEVRIEAHTRGVGASNLHLVTRQQGSDVVLSAQPDPWLSLMRSRPGVRVRAWVPAAYRVEVHGDAVEVYGIVERALARTGSRP